MNEKEIKFDYKSNANGKWYSIPKRTLMQFIGEDREEALRLDDMEAFELADDALLSCSRNECFSYKGIIYDPVEYRLNECEGGAVSATQPSMVDGGKVDVFGSNGSSFAKKQYHNVEEFYNDLLKLEDYE